MILLPLIVWPGFQEEIRAPKAIAMLLFAGLSYAWILAKNVAPEFGVFFVCVTLNAVLTGMNPNFQMLEWISIGATLGAGAYVSRGVIEDYEYVLKGIMWGALFSAAYAYIQMLGLDFIFIYHTPEAGRVPLGMMGQQTLLGPFLAAAFVISLFYRKWWATIFLLAPILITKSSFTYASLFGGVLLYLCYVFPIRKICIGLAVALPVASILLYLNPAWLHDQGRFHVWSNVLSRAIKEAPLFGHGVGSYKLYAHQVEGCEIEHNCRTPFQDDASLRMHGIFREAHNDLVQWFFDTGVTGLIALSLIMGSFIMRLVEYFRFREIACAGSVALVFFIDAMGNFPMRLVPQGTIAAICVIIVCTFRRGVFLDR